MLFEPSLSLPNIMKFRLKALLSHINCTPNPATASGIIESPANAQRYSPPLARFLNDDNIYIKRLRASATTLYA